MSIFKALFGVDEEQATRDLWKKVDKIDDKEQLKAIYQSQPLKMLGMFAFLKLFDLGGKNATDKAFRDLEQAVYDLGPVLNRFSKNEVILLGSDEDFKKIRSLIERVRKAYKIDQY